MPSKMTFQRNLIGMEDLLLGLGQTMQTRGITDVLVTRINAAIFPYDENFTLKDKIDSLDTTHYVDSDNLPVYIATPHSASNLFLPDVIWIKDVSPTERHVYYYDQLMYKFNPEDGDLILDPSVFAPIMADISTAIADGDAATLASATTLVNQETAARQAAITQIIADYKAADTAIIANLALGTASKEDVGTDPGDVIQLDTDGRLPAVDGSQLTNLPVASAASGSLVQRTFDEYTAVTDLTVSVPRAGAAPPNTAGTQVMSRTYTPKGIGNKILVRIRGNTSNYNKAPSAILLFKDGVFEKGDIGWSHQIHQTHTAAVTIEAEFTAASLDPITFAVRAGPIGAGPIKLNDSSWGLTGRSCTMVIEEVKA